MSDPIIKVRRMGKRYRLGQVQGYKTLRESPTGWLSSPLRRRAGSPVAEQFWSLRDIGFDSKSASACQAVTP